MKPQALGWRNSSYHLSAFLAMVSSHFRILITRTFFRTRSVFVNVISKPTTAVPLHILVCPLKALRCHTSLATQETFVAQAHKRHLFVIISLHLQDFHIPHDLCYLAFI
mmetsp:Transcript_15306/g.26798  ORF Transcript_15306/g.26798 Transcript_15306/m.26798 type:complete len:109 (-) Transcript_15306:69-395(-)